MSIQNITAIQAPSGQRVRLADAIPLSAPIVVQIFDVYACNLACKFCHYGLDKDKRPQLSTTTIMELSLFKKIIDDMTKFPNKIKMLRFCGAGESLLNKNLVEMVRYASEKKVAEKIELITNGILLTPEISKDLIKAGLNQLRMSIYGLSSQKYKEITLHDIDFNKLVNNAKFFYEEKQKQSPALQVYIKTMDVSLENDDEKEKFIELFSPHCDSYAIESIVPNVQGLDYSEWLDGIPQYNALGVKLPEIKICPQPYHLITICPDGRVVPCSNETMIGIGDVNLESLVDIWNGKILKNTQKQMLDGAKNFDAACKTCSIVQCRPFPEDILDNDREKLKSIYN